LTETERSCASVMRGEQRQAEIHVCRIGGGPARRIMVVPADVVGTSSGHPDGTQLAFVSDVSDEPALMVVSVSERMSRRVGAGRMSTTRFFTPNIAWIGDTSIVYVSSEMTFETTRTGPARRSSLHSKVDRLA